MWSNTYTAGNYRPRDIPFQGNEGIKVPLPQNPEEVDFFNFTDAVIDIIWRKTNRYSHQYIEANRTNLRPQSIIHEWQPTNANEIKAFLGLCIIMGIIYKPRIWMYWSTDSVYNTPIFSQVMTRKRCQLLMKFLHFQNNAQYNPNDPQRDRLFKIRTIMDLLKNRFKTMYYPSEHITVDESLVPYKGRLMFKQFIKTKRARFGIKMYELASAEGILIDFLIYQGNLEAVLLQPPGKNWLHTERIPLTFLDSYLDKGHTLCTDNFYTTPKMAKYLLERQTKTVGTIKPNRKNFPKDFPADKDMQKGTAVFKEYDNILVMKYTAAKDKSQKKPEIVHMLSTKHLAKMKNTTNRDAQENVVQKPEAIMYYN